jgi:hypothetical protein
MFNKKYGNNVVETARVCRKCGEPITDTSSSAYVGKAGLVAGILIAVLITGVASWFIFGKSRVPQLAPESAHMTLEGTPSQSAEFSLSEQATPEAVAAQMLEEETQATLLAASASVFNVSENTFQKSANKSAGKKSARAGVKGKRAKFVRRTMKPFVMKTVDAAYNERSARECAQGISGFFCRESLRTSMCRRHWSEYPPEGKKLCRLNQ